MRLRNGIGALLACLALTTLALPVRADTPPANLDSAKELFRRGVVLLGAGDTERALDYFLRSRELLPASKNTVNAAICLERLGRLDEALELYEEVLARFAADLDDDDRNSLRPVMAALRERIGYLELSSNVAGLVVVDGRARGTLPLRTSLRVLPGKRKLRVVKDGYRSYEQMIELSAAQTLSVDAELEPLAGTGALRVESFNGVAAQVWIDGKPVGLAPWESTIARGPHVVRITSGELGSEPQRVDVLESKTLLYRVGLRRLAPPLHVSVAPKTAALFLGDVPLGTGSWSGRLPEGRFRLTVREEGYIDVAQNLDLHAASEPPPIEIALTRDPQSPRWPRASHFRFELGAALTPFFAPALKSGAERSCISSDCAGSHAAWGAAAGISALALHDNGFGAEIQLGYLRFRQSFARAVVDPQPDAAVTYALQQTLEASGVLVAARAELQRRLGLGLDFMAALGGGALILQYSESASGSVWTNAAPVPLRSSTGTASEVAPFVSSALGVQRRVGPFLFHALLGAWFFPTQGQPLNGPALGVAPSCPQESPPGAVGCTKSVALGERAHGRFFAFVPELAARYAF